MRNQNGVIRNCGCEIHHIIPVCENGTDEPENLILLCPNCHELADANVFSRDFLKANAMSADELESAKNEHIRKSMTQMRLF